MIFSLLKIRKKTSAVIVGVLIGAACLWGISLWQGIGPRQMIELFLGTFLFLLAIMLVAGTILIVVKGLSRLLRHSSGDDEPDDPGL